MTELDEKGGTARAAPYFTREEFTARLAAVRQVMAARGLDLLLLSAPENIFYLTGLDHWGYFAPHLLLVPADGEMALVTRAMEKVTIGNQVVNARFFGHGDHESAAEAFARALGERRYRAQQIGIESWSSGLPHGLTLALQRHAPSARWLDASGLVDELRLVKSPAERAYLRQAARVSDAGAAAAIEATCAGASERHIAAECERAMIEAGGTFPGFGPFIRSTSRLGEEHTTWTDARLVVGDALFLELTGCVARYHAPLGRLIHIGHAPKGAPEMAAVAQAAFEAVLGALKEGALACDVYAAWQRVVDRAGLPDYRRHHCGYAVGIGFPPSWTGGNKVTGLRHDSDMPIRVGMSFHVLSWLMGTGRGDFFISNAVLLGESGAEVLTRTPAGVTIR
ncbi:MAG TPA: Xaa-Pro peptidase family protein [Alphaproteobacteria bacterium]|nr:Xaa-Pro peptidase family protein [Alphaproteobacteria bacterium]